ncbi:uracil-DNA glycosylase-like isoform X2 [Thrips palmi]|uniref:Uracil-DNA glycosylase n=1 Tax=Thrips palmi TaxID=161013 RepID=A0A6P9A9R6_THRPL|nr:uracil-DNA glycosylase-like isoform X2 [Thrips palmi]
MSQKNLMSFFKPVQKKRTSTEANLLNASGDVSENDSKRMKVDATSVQKTSSDIADSIIQEETPAPSDVKTASDDNPDAKSQNSDLKENDPNASNALLCTPPNKVNPDKKVMSPFGMITPLQCLAKIKSQVAKTPALHHSIGSSWFFALHSEFQKPYFSKLSEFVSRERQRGPVFPPADQVWTWTTKVPIKEIKVVILGQDPYHNPGQAHGLCFSVPKGVTPPPSLLNMYKELSTDIPGFVAPKHGYLDGWAQQGVLLLNACLTVRANSPNSHKDQGWEQLTDAVIKYISENGRNVVFLLWGSYAQKKGSVVDKKKHHILKTVHPSPLSAHRGFLGCKHFSLCNDFLKKSGKKPIDWSYLP